VFTMRTFVDYLILRLANNTRLVVAFLFLVVGIAVRIASATLGANSAFTLASTVVVAIILTINSALWLNDVRKAREGRFDKAIVENPDFFAKACTLALGRGRTLGTFGDSVVCSDESLGLRLESAVTFLEIVPQHYSIPLKLKPYLSALMQYRRPTHNESKVRLLSDVTQASLDGTLPLRVQRTNYFCGVGTNEASTYVLRQADWAHNRDDTVCDVLDDFIAKDGALVPLSESAFSNHIGVTTLVITSDSCIVLQRQGTTLVEPGRITVGASGSADWPDVRRSADVFDPQTGTYRKTLQNLVRFASEREAKEEIGATVGPGHSKTTLTGFARFIHRGGKPEFFSITFLKERFTDLPPRVRVAERKWVREKMKRELEGESVEAAMEGIRSVREEFRRLRTASTSMMVALDCALAFLGTGLASVRSLKP
jgi:hypothetical protein